jgi:hypothetical protein
MRVDSSRGFECDSSSAWIQSESSEQRQHGGATLSRREKPDEKPLMRSNFQARACDSNTHYLGHLTIFSDERLKTTLMKLFLKREGILDHVPLASQDWRV